MEINETEIKGVYIVEPAVFGDNRGWFTESYSAASFAKAGLNYDFVQDNHSYSARKGVLRGLHFQNNPMAQTKLVRCTRGSILDVAVDIRRGSDTYLKYVTAVLSAENKRQLLVPRGCAHGFVTLEDDSEVQYKTDNFYSKEHDRGIRFDDPAIGVPWNTDNPVLSDKDGNSPLLKDSDCNFTIKVLVTGAKGQLGHDMLSLLREKGYECLGADIDEFDITDAAATDTFIRAYAPDVVVHCSAYTAVDKAESDAERCCAVNVTGSKNIARVCAAIGAKLVYISTDYVYGGGGDAPHETDAPKNPAGVYARTKLAGEVACAAHVKKLFVVRTSWVFGTNGNNFVKTMLRLADEKKELNVVNDQTGSPTYSADLAAFLFHLINTDKYGTYNFCNEGFCTWYDFAAEIFRLFGKKVKLNAVTSAQYKTAATRPANSRLSKKTLIDCGYPPPPHWTDALTRYKAELQAVKKEKE
jgi:dTDP-4-dehydrorhamnose reductase/dTDP-4-dehydrorhamnose 3,5-epimerase